MRFVSSAILTLAAAALLGACVATPEVKLDATGATPAAAPRTERAAQQGVSVDVNAFRVPQSGGAMPRGSAVH